MFISAGNTSTGLKNMHRSVHTSSNDELKRVDGALEATLCIRFLVLLWYESQRRRYHIVFQASNERSFIGSNNTLHHQNNCSDLREETVRNRFYFLLIGSDGQRP